jgi:hypothetical protein
MGVFAIDEKKGIFATACQRELQGTLAIAKQ